MPRMPITVAGRFPPPLDGQAIATARLADLLDIPGGPFEVERLNLGAPEGSRLVSGTPFSPARAAHFVRQRGAVRRALTARPEAPVLWPSISPSPLGHARDLLTVVPGFGARRVVAVVHRGDFARLFASPLTRRTGLRLARRLHRIVFLTAGLSKQCARWLPAHQRAVVPNTIDDVATPSPEELAEARVRRTTRGGARLLYLSGMIPSKGYPDVLEALGRLRARGVDARATFAGRWPSAEAEAAFRSRIAVLGLTENADVLGGVSDRDAVRRLYLDADVFVLPTTYPVEAQPLTVIEALAAGTPVVVTRHAGLPEMVREGVEAGFVPAGAPDAIADAVERLTAPGAWIPYSVAARARFDVAFSPRVVREAWTALLGAPSVA